MFKTNQPKETKMSKRLVSQENSLKVKKLMENQKKIEDQEKQELSNEIINICNGNKGNIYCDKYELSERIKKVFQLYDIA